MKDPATSYVQSSQQRIEAARSIADSLRHKPELHKLAMMAVFVLEDCHEAFRRLEMTVETGGEQEAEGTPSSKA